MQVKSIAECSKGSILQYFRPSSYHLSLKSLFCLGFLTKSGKLIDLSFLVKLENTIENIQLWAAFTAKIAYSMYIMLDLSFTIVLLWMPANMDLHYLKINGRINNKSQLKMFKNMKILQIIG